jgi:hypothetical protein
MQGLCCTACRYCTESSSNVVRHKCRAVDLCTVLGQIADLQSTYGPKKIDCGVRFRFSNVVPGYPGTGGQAGSLGTLLSSLLYMSSSSSVW